MARIKSKKLKNPLPLYKTFDGKRYKRWNSTYHLSVAVGAAKDYRRHGLLVRVVTEDDMFAPKNLVYGVYVHGSVFNIVKPKE